MIVSGTIEVALGLAVAALAVWMSSSSIAADPAALVFLAILALGSVVFGLYLLNSVRAKAPGYWSSRNLPDIAFEAHHDGISLHDPETDGVIEVPWRAITAIDATRLFLRFRFTPGTLEAKYRNQFLCGRSTLDQDAATIRRAATALSGREY
ncbi:MAG: hypothetical protein ACOH1T_10460 [Microbacteriaceae bacterium]